MKKTRFPFLLAILLVPCALLLNGATLFSERFSERGFSRSRWLEEHEVLRNARGDVEEPPAARPKQGNQAPVVSVPGLAPAATNFRVSSDLLQAARDGSQPETETEPYIAVNPEREGHLLAAYQEGRYSEGGARALTWAVSFDGGRTWEEGLIPHLSLTAGGPFERVSDPWVAFGLGDRAYYVTLAFNETSAPNGIFVSSSSDGGLTWGEPVTVHLGGADFDDKEAIIVDTYPDSPFRGRVYVAWDTVTTDRRQPPLFSYSTNDGASFRQATTLDSSAPALGTIPLVLPGGAVVVIWLRGTGNNVQVVAARSTDGGNTWSAPFPIAAPHAAGIAGSRTGDGLPSAAVDAVTGDLYVTWQDDRFSRGVDQAVLSRSSDGGRTWSAPQQVSDGPLQLPNFTPAVAVTAEGQVGVVYYSTRNDPARRLLLDEYLAVSSDHGVSFGPSRRLSATSWDPSFAAFSRGLFLGDYQGLAGGRHAFHPLWIATFNASRIAPSIRQPDAFTRPVKAP